MDTAINNGDFLTDVRGIPIAISGAKEILQRALIRLSVKKGAFLYDLNLGSNLLKLKSNSKNIKNESLNMVKEALSPISNLTVKDVSVEYLNSGENLNLHVDLIINNQKEELEVII